MNRKQVIAAAAAGLALCAVWMIRSSDVVFGQLEPSVQVP